MLVAWRVGQIGYVFADSKKHYYDIMSLLILKPLTTVLPTGEIIQARDIDLRYDSHCRCHFAVRMFGTCWYK